MRPCLWWRSSAQCSQRKRRNDIHDSFGVKVIKVRLPELSGNETSLPHMIYTFFESYTSSKVNEEVTKAELSDLWLTVMDYLSGLMSSVTHCNIKILYEVAYRGIKDHSDLMVRQRCEEYLTKLVQHLYPPRDFHSRRHYLHIFFSQYVRYDSNDYNVKGSQTVLR